VKENRTFDTLFGTFPGANGASQGTHCDGTTVQLARASDSVNDLPHSFADGIAVIDGGKMDCFADAGYVQYDEQEIPNYWAYARQFVLADNFFSSEYGPTCVEHFFNYAAQSDRFVDCAPPRTVRSEAARVLRRPLRAGILVPPLHQGRAATGLPAGDRGTERGIGGQDALPDPVPVLGYPRATGSPSSERDQLEGVPRQHAVGAAAPRDPSHPILFHVSQRGS
jgi:hypothetical protein